MTTSEAVTGAVLAIVDDAGGRIEFDAVEAEAFLAITDGLEAATTSACARCWSRVLACVALVELLDGAPPHPRTTEIVELADDAPTLHVYVVDLAQRCTHRTWRDPGHEEWLDAVQRPGLGRRRP
ncbi:MAG: hypothetical protein ACKOZL_02685 [Actinomycetes bacterium]